VVTKAEQQTSPFDTVKLLLAFVILIAGVVGFYYFEDESQLLRVAGMLAIAVLAVFVALATDLGQRAFSFTKEARVEVRKVVWPTRQEALQTTIAVLIMVVVVAIALFFVDMFLGWAVTWLLA
jgi:preprotein translocase subunit SecE